MATTTFDALAYAQQMEKAGVDRKVAETQAEILQRAFNQYDEANRRALATKADLQHGLDSLRIELGAKIDDTRHEILKWTMAAVIAQTALIAAMIGVVIAYLPK